MFNGTELGYKRKSLVNIASTLCVCGAFLVLSQGKVNAAVQNTTNEEDSTENVSNSISEYNINAQSVALSDASSVTSESSSDNDAVSQETVVASSTAVIGDTNNDASSESAAAVSDVNENSATSDVDSTSTEYTSDSNIVNVIDLGAVDSVNDVEAAKAAAEQVYEETGQAQTITASMVSSYSYTDAFLDSIKAGAIQGWVNYRILPSVTAAQAICESAWGRSDLATSAHNLFGIKGSYNGNSVSYPTAEWGSGGYYTINAAFRAYSSNSESVADHGNFLVSNSRYANLINNRNYVSVANNLQADGYATSPTYASTLIGIVQQYGLTSWDTEAFALTDKVNAGSLEAAVVSGDSMYIRGWHVATDAEGKNNAFVIILDSNTNQELARYKITPTTRNDVGSAYSKVTNSANSGFEISVPFTSQFAGKNVTVISRYSSSSDGNSDYVDYNFSADFNKNVGNIDNFSLNEDGTISVSGWHAADATVTDTNHFIILYDATTNKEVTQIKVDNSQRNDVAGAYGDVYNSVNSGFNVKMKYSASLVGHTLKVVSRYSSSAEGNGASGSYVDYWSDGKVFGQNQSSLDSFDVQGKSLVVSGWHANNDSIELNNRFIIIYDATKGTEIGRYNVDSVERRDVQNYLPSVFNADKSGFSLNIQLTQEMIGDDIQVISRYSSQNDGEGYKVDNYFTPKKFNQSAASLDNFSIDGDKITISGWDANDYGAGLDNRFIILYDKTKNKEITRINISDIDRQDVADQFGGYYNASKSGFSISIKLTNAMIGDELQVVSRYSNSKDGEGIKTDHWFDTKTFNVNEGRLDSVNVQNGSININGWHVSDSAVDKPFRYIILWDATTGTEITRKLVDFNVRTDVSQYLPDAYQSALSGFNTSISMINVPKGHKLQIISRYSDAASGEGNNSDIWFDKFTI
jgi:flagellum-specific peptidoglycan hydrolase FlgJ